MPRFTIDKDGIKRPVAPDTPAEIKAKKTKQPGKPVKAGLSSGDNEGDPQP